MKYDATTIARATGGRVLAEAPAGEILTDTRKLVPGSWFLAITGERFDGHDFLDTAAQAGAIGCIVSREPAGWGGGAVLVPDTVRALQDLGRHVRSELRVPVVGLTGSSGKTTTRALIALALSPLGRVHQTVGNLNNHLGVPMTLLATPPDADAVVIEMGTSSHGEIALLADIARPTVRLLLNIGPAHLEELGGLAGVAREKGQLVATMGPDDIAVINVDDPYLAALEVPGTCVTWGTAKADLVLRDVHVEVDTLHTTATVDTPSGPIALRIPAPGAHIVHNAVGALAVASALGVDLHAAAAAMGDYAPVGMRMRAEPLYNGAIALNDAYNANPQSMEASLRLLASLPGRRAAVLGDMLELGGDEAIWHQRIATLASELGLDRVVLVGPRMSATDAPDAWHHADGLEAVDRLRAWLQPGDRVLFKGSRGARVERILHSVRDDPSSEDP